jgi:hypothetical protein
VENGPAPQPDAVVRSTARGGSAAPAIRGRTRTLARLDENPGSLHDMRVDCGERVVERSRPPTLSAKARGHRGDLLIAAAGDSAQTSRIIDGRARPPAGAAQVSPDHHTRPGESPGQRGDVPMANAEKVAKAGVTREAGWLYYIDKAGNIARSKMVRGGQKKKPGDKAEVVAKTGVTRDNNFIYFMDNNGDVARVPRSKGGTARSKKKSKKKAAKKPAKKAAKKGAKKTAKKAGGAKKAAKKAPAKKAAKKAPAKKAAKKAKKK